MAALRAPSPAFLSAFLPIARAQLFPPSTSSTLKRLPLLQRLRATASLIPGALVPIPSLLQDIWDGILRAVPKKKTSHMKKRHRQMAGKALKDVTALNKCSACGRPKRAHVLCPYCVNSIRAWIGNGFKSKDEVQVELERQYEVYNRERKQMGLKQLDVPGRKNEKGKEGGKEKPTGLDQAVDNVTQPGKIDGRLTSSLPAPDV